MTNKHGPSGSVEARWHQAKEDPIFEIPLTEGCSPDFRRATEKTRSARTLDEDSKKVLFEMISNNRDTISGTQGRRIILNEDFRIGSQLYQVRLSKNGDFGCNELSQIESLNVHLANIEFYEEVLTMLINTRKANRLC